MFHHVNGGGHAIIRFRFALEKVKKEQLLLIEWGKFRSMGEGFASVGSNVKKTYYFFNELVGRVGIEPTTN